ncbi:MAG: RibD family protein [Desulfomonile tiedjei]|uniref:RibD family protein n=1 Tax=Desulfomonile tiedjei TaxID=2358 RepID=A0A9D6V2T9_9BACT|nr:RibD family protein [Desulfomonile tiedjei]
MGNSADSNQAGAVLFFCGMDFLKSLLALSKNHFDRTRRPFVTLSYAQSLDGCISAKPGEALPLSGRKSLTLTHQLRASHDAILVGIGTVLSDNPRLNVRLVHGKNPRPVVVDSRLRLPLDSNLLNQDSRRPIIISTGNYGDDRLKAVEAAGAEVHAVPTRSGTMVDLSAMLDMLGEMGIRSLMVEGGSGIITNFLLEKLADYIVLTVAPVMVGGLRAVKDLRANAPESFPRVLNPGHRWLGEDLILWGDLT